MECNHSEGLKDTFPYLDNVTVAGVDQADHDRNVAAFLEMTTRRNITLNASKTVHSAAVIDILDTELVTIAYNQILKNYGRCRNIHLLRMPHLYVEL